MFGFQIFSYHIHQFHHTACRAFSVTQQRYAMSYLALSTQAEVQFEALVREYSPFEGISAQAFESNRPTRILQEKH